MSRGSELESESEETAVSVECASARVEDVARLAEVIRLFITKIRRLVTERTLSDDVERIAAHDGNKKYYYPRTELESFKAQILQCYQHWEKESEDGETTARRATMLMYLAGRAVTPHTDNIDCHNEAIMQGVACLLDAFECEVNVCDQFGRTALMYVAMENKFGWVARDPAPSVNALVPSMDAGFSSQHAYFTPGREKLVKLLLDRGADPGIKDNGDRSAIDYFKKNFGGNHPVIDACFAALPKGRRTKGAGGDASAGAAAAAAGDDASAGAAAAAAGGDVSAGAAAAAAGGDASAGAAAHQALSVVNTGSTGSSSAAGDDASAGAAARSDAQLS